MIEVRAYEPDDIFKIDPKDFFHEEMDTTERINQYTKNPKIKMFTVCEDKVPIAVIGGTNIWGRTWEVWSVMSPLIHNNPAGFARLCKAMIDKAGITLNAKRIHSLCGGRVKGGEKWFKFLGFKHEATMAAFGPGGEDYHIYVRHY